MRLKLKRRKRERASAAKVRLKKQRRKLAKKKGVKAGSLEDVCVRSFVS